MIEAVEVMRAQVSAAPQTAADGEAPRRAGGRRLLLPGGLYFTVTVFAPAAVGGLTFRGLNASRA